MDGVTLTGGVLQLTGQPDKDARVFLRSGTSLQEVTTVDLGQAEHLGEDGLSLLLRCLQQVWQHHPGTRLQIRGAGQHAQQQLDLLGVAPWVDLRD